MIQWPDVLLMAIFVVFAAFCLKNQIEQNNNTDYYEQQIEALAELAGVVNDSLDAIEKKMINK